MLPPANVSLNRKVFIERASLVKSISYALSTISLLVAMHQGARATGLSLFSAKSIDHTALAIADQAVTIAATTIRIDHCPLAIGQHRYLEPWGSRIDFLYFKS